MELQKIEGSSNIAEVGYDQNSRRLRVRFINGHLYEYIDVPKSVSQKFLIADSKGKFFHLFIREQYIGKKVHEPEEREAASESVPAGTQSEDVSDGETGSL